MDHPTPTRAVCPICSAEEAEALHTFGSDEVAQHYALKESDPERYERFRREIERLWGGATCRVLRCRACGFIHADPFVPGDGPFYSLFYDDPRFPAWKWEYEETMRVLREEAGGGRLHQPRVLEIGAGTGMFVGRVAREITPAGNILTLEYSDAGAAAIRAQGIASLQTDLHSLGAEYDGTFDVLCLYQVLEHMNELDRVFADLHRIAAPGALLFIAVPSDAMMTFYEEKGAWLDTAPVHLSRWNRESFRMIGERHGWRIEAHDVEPDTVLQRFTQFALYGYVHRTKRSGTLFNWAERRRNRLVRYLFQVPLISLMALRYLPSAPALMKKVKGHSQMVRMVKEGGARSGGNA